MLSFKLCIWLLTFPGMKVKPSQSYEPQFWWNLISAWCSVDQGWHGGLSGGLSGTSRVGGLNPLSALCAQSLHVFPVLLGLPLGTTASSPSPKTRQMGISNHHFGCVCDCILWWVGTPFRVSPALGTKYPGIGSRLPRNPIYSTISSMENEWIRLEIQIML